MSKLPQEDNNTLKEENISRFDYGIFENHEEIDLDPRSLRYVVGP